MTRPLFAFACLALLSLLGRPSFAQDEETKPALKKAAGKSASSKSSKAEKKEPHVEIVGKLEGKSDDFDVPAKAIPMLNRAVTAAKKNKDGFEFETLITIEQTTRRFTNPTEALETCKALGEAIRDLKKAGAGFDDVGEIPDASPDDIKFDAKKIAAGRAELERRVTLAMQQQPNRGGAPGGRPQVPNPQQLQARQQELQEIYQEELAKAKQEGILPASFDAAPVQQAAPQSLEERKNAVIDEVRNHLQGTFGKGAKVGGEPAEKPAEKPAANS